MALTEDEDDALVAYVQWMERTGMPATTEQVGAVANTLRMRRNPNASPASARWLANWRENHPAIAKTCLKAVERARVSFEAQKQEEVEMFYSRLQDIVNRYKIGASEIWNEDEAGIRIGCLRERVSVLIIRTTRVKHALYGRQPNQQAFYPYSIFHMEGFRYGLRYLRPHGTYSIRMEIQEVTS
ncbi:hypothetical protein NQ176_g1659 [Zarea fungicola]|uniref:Uncharacterized protein n=1 Tax=Zarea fungicola TaxID=93591 RepID=A0ACC1NU70_9HYPO|nr:hypothetical protein NQ176_g1659 [Lecanicillium fungicola]